MVESDDLVRVEGTLPRGDINGTVNQANLTMPGLSGRETMRVTRARSPQIKVVLCSGYLIGNSAATDKIHAPHASVAKPFTAAELVSTMCRVVSEDRVGI